MPYPAAAPGSRTRSPCSRTRWFSTIGRMALARHGEDLDRRADRRIRTFVLETIPAVLADRARLERTAGDRAGMAGIQEEPDDAGAWRQRADPVIRTGTALLHSKRMAALLDAVPGRRAGITNDSVIRTALLDSKRMAALLDAAPDHRDALDSTTAYLRDTLRP